MSGQYILSEDGFTPIPEPDLMAWGKWMQKDRVRIVKQEELPDGRYLSTVFLGLDHAYDGGGPLLWETMLFEKKGSGHALDSDRCGGDRPNAERMHAEMLAKHTRE